EHRVHGEQGSPVPRGILQHLQSSELCKPRELRVRFARESHSHRRSDYEHLGYCAHDPVRFEAGVLRANSGTEAEFRPWNSFQDLSLGSIASTLPRLIKRSSAALNTPQVSRFLTVCSIPRNQ